MTTAEHFRSAISQPSSDVSIAGVPWPAYKVLALVIGLLVLVAVAVVTASAASAVLGGAAAATVVWLGLSIFHAAR
ncbi:MAG: hypothetical protein ABWY93_07120 [Mycobacterium sp.]